MPNYSSLYSGLDYKMYKYSTVGDAGNIDSLIKKMVEKNKSDVIICLTMVPRKFVGYFEGGTGVINDGQREQTYNTEINANLNGYVPKNNKLFTYPYNFLCVDCLTDTHIYKYELFNSFESDDSIEFQLLFVLEPNPSILISPKNYNVLNSPLSGYNHTESVLMDGFPQCAATIDSYRAWLAMNANSNALDRQSAGLGIASGLVSAASGGVMATVGAASGNIPMVVGGAGMMMGGGKSAISSAIDMERVKNEQTVQSTKGSTVRGQQANGARMSARCVNIYFKRMCVKAENARVIDDFFTRYGYAINRIQTPNFNARRRFTYVKTVDASMLGNIPASDMAIIKNNLNRGITFFNQLTRIGDYEVTGDDPNDIV